VKPAKTPEDKVDCWTSSCSSVLFTYYCIKVKAAMRRAKADAARRAKADAARSTSAPPLPTRMLPGITSSSPAVNMVAQPVYRDPMPVRRCSACSSHTNHCL
jgi:hypothetical protein